MIRIVGVDFSSAPSKRKPIVVAFGTFDGHRLAIEGFDAIASLEGFEEWLASERAFVGGFDFPFGLPRPFLESSPDLPRTWLESVAWLRATSRDALRDHFKRYTSARPVGSKFAHRAVDRLAGSSPSMKWVNPPVAFMLREGVSRLVEAGVDLPGLHRTGDPRVALEAYPGVVARAITRASYKSDERAKQTAGRRDERIRIVDALANGSPLGLPLVLTPASRERAIDDASGDVLDALICAVQAAKAAGEPDYGIPADVDPLEGFIVGIP